MTEGQSQPGGRSWTRLIGARALTVVAILLALVGMLAFYVENTALDEDGFETISRNMIEDDEIRTQVAASTVERLFANVDVEAAIADDCLRRNKGWRRYLPVSRVRAPIAQPLRRSSGHAYRRYG